MQADVVMEVLLSTTAKPIARGWCLSGEKVQKLCSSFAAVSVHDGQEMALGPESLL